MSLRIQNDIKLEESAVWTEITENYCPEWYGVMTGYFQNDVKL